MATIDTHHGHAPSPITGGGTYHDNYQAAPHFLDREHEFDSCKMGIWLFLATEILLFSGMFCAYGVFRMLHPEAFIAGGGHLEVKWGFLNTLVLLFSSWTVATAVRNAQMGEIGKLKAQPDHHHRLRRDLRPHQVHLRVRRQVPARPPPRQVLQLPVLREPLRADVVGRLLGRDRHPRDARHRGHGADDLAVYPGVQAPLRPAPLHRRRGCGLYWHIVDIVWIFLFPMLYLIH